MSPTASQENPHCANRQRGIALLIVLALLVLLVGAVMVGFAGDLAQQNRKQQQTTDALAKAKEALIGYAAKDPNQPGVLPCPDSDNDGSADSPCGATGVTAIGRLPWKTLGLPDVRDGAGECLWYAVSANFKNSGTSAPAVVNSDSPGTLVVNDAGGTPVYSGSNTVVAIVFAPGSTLPGQDRIPSSTTVCGGNTIAANYLEGGNENGAATNIFVTAQATDVFNDKLLPITSEALFPVVEMRVAREIRQVLRDYYQANRFYPTAAQFPNNSSTAGTYRGYIPTTVCSPVPALSLPAWLVANNWHQFMVYAVAPRCTPKITTTLLDIATQPSCALSCAGPIAGLYTCIMPDTIDNSVLDCTNTTAGPFLTVNGIGSSIQSVVLSASYGLAQPPRPCSEIGDCLESVNGDDENIDLVDNYVYVKPVRSSTNNDSLVIVSP